MIKRLYQLFKPSDPHSPLIVHDKDHGVSRTDLSDNACKVIDRLNSSGFSAYLVGGGVRDLLLGESPKDFDVATEATPEQVKSLFRNSRIIGKRFRIVHVRYGREIIEVTTFRGAPQKAESSSKHSQSDKGILLRDNVYGDIRSDALRRDFTVNALYYAPKEGTLLDYADGLADLEARQLRIIGDANERYKEDPVRMLRAVRFAAKLGFSLTPDTEKPIYEHAEYLADIPPARLFEEVLKLFVSGYATAVVTKLRDFGLMQYLFPGIDACFELEGGHYQKLMFAMATNTDKRLRKNKRVTPAFIYAVMLWPPLQTKIKELIDGHKISYHDAMQQAAQGIISQQLSYTAIPKRFLIPMREIWSLQKRLARREGKKAFLLLDHPRFRAAYDFLLLREEAGENVDGLGMWWTKFQAADHDERSKMVKGLPASKKPRSRRRSNRSQNANGANKK